MSDHHPDAVVVRFGKLCTRLRLQPATPRPRTLRPGSPEQKRLDELLRVLRDDSRPDGERLAAAKEALPLQHIDPEVVMFVSVDEA